MNPRLRRLEADQVAMHTAFAGHQWISIEPIGPSPAERYRITFRVPALRRSPTNELERIELIVVDIALPSGYPREKPYCTTATPVFHPNFGNYICIADFWSPSNTIVDTVVQIGDMLQYKSFNTSSPLNALAARWVIDNLALVPIGDRELLPVEPEIRLGSSVTSPVEIPETPVVSYGLVPSPFPNPATETAR